MVSLPLTKLINKSFETGFFPDIAYAKWQKWYLSSQMKPVYFAIIIYRAISLISNIGKIIEKLMHQRHIFFL